jgi:hypothetical protein
MRYDILLELTAPQAKQVFYVLLTLYGTKLVSWGRQGDTDNCGVYARLSELKGEELAKMISEMRQVARGAAEMYNQLMDKD